MPNFMADRTLPTITVAGKNKARATFCAGTYHDGEEVLTVMAKMTEDLVFGQRVELAEVSLTKAAQLISAYDVEGLEQLFQD